MKISRGDYVNGKKQGIWIEYTTDKNGKRVMEIGSYDNGIRYGEWRHRYIDNRTPEQIKNADNTLRGQYSIKPKEIPLETYKTKKTKKKAFRR